MARTKISEFSSTPANNTDIDSINIAEGCSPSGINDAIRELMSQLKDWQSGTSNDPYVVGSSGSLTLNQGTANGVAYLNGSKVVTSGSALVFDGTNLGVGASSPAYKLDVRGVLGSGNGTITSGFSYDSGGLVGTFSNHALGVLTNGNVVAKFDTSGNLGLGVTPSAWDSSVFKAFEIPAGSFNAYQTSQININQNAYYAGAPNYWTYKSTAAATQYRQTAGAHSWYTAPSGTAGNAITFTQAMTLDASGNLGVGTTSPAARLHSTSSSNQLTISEGSSLGATFDYRSSTGNLSIATNGINARTSPQLVLDLNGNLLVGTTSADPIAAGVNGVQLGAANSRIASASIGLSVARRASNGTTISFLRDSTAVGSIDVTTTATSYVTSSDYRLKNTIAPITGALAKVAQLKPVTYKWNADGSDGEGFIAHELAEVVPQCVSGEKDAVDEDGNPKYQGIDTSFLVATLTAAIQEQQAIIESLKARLDAANL